MLRTHKSLDLDPHSSKGLKVRCSLSSFITSTVFLLITFKNSSLSHLRPWLSMCLWKRSPAESSVRKFCNTFSEKSRGASRVVVPVVGNETVLRVLVLLSCRRNIESKCSFLLAQHSLVQRLRWRMKKYIAELKSSDFQTGQVKQIWLLSLDLQVPRSRQISIISEMSSIPHLWSLDIRGITLK